ncbi:MAG: DUF3179 domain-containing protein [Gammaproteobacteria bacterium]|jgi:hypothetical protein|nr:DUF3179 domain-containing protein [Gammaproteobacteria bacterium]
MSHIIHKILLASLLMAIPFIAYAINIGPTPDDYYKTHDYGYNYVEGMTRLSIIFAILFFSAALAIIHFVLSNKVKQLGIFAAAVAVTVVAYMSGVAWYICFWLPLIYFLWPLYSLWTEPMIEESRQKFFSSLKDKDQETKRSSKIIFWSGMLIAQTGALLGWAEMGDLTQMWVQSPRWLAMHVYIWRWPIFWISFVALGLSIWIWNREKVIQKGWVLALSVLTVVNVTSWFIPAQMFQTKQHDAEFVNFDVADEVLFERTELTVIEIDGEAVGYPDPFIVQAHATGTEIAGQKVAMTHCGLTHLSMAYEPIIDGEEVNLKVFTQLANNLVLVDTKTEQPIQQLSGKTEFSGKSMKSLPSFRINYGNYKKLFPDGKVFWYPIVDFAEDPIEHLWNSWVRWIIYMLVNEQHANPTEATFPTVDWDDQRLPAKELIYGLRGELNQDAYTKDYIVSNKNIKSIIDGREVRVIYFSELDSVMAFYSDGYEGPITPYGLTDDGRELDRYEGLVSEAFWMIWVYFYPGTSAFS